MFKKTHYNTLLGSILIGSMAAISTPAMATNDAMMDLLEILYKKGSITKDEYDLLKNASAADKEKVEGTVNEMKATVDKKTKDMPKINTKGKLEFKHGDNKIRVGGRLQGDVTFAAGDANLGSEGGTPVTEFRRARMYLSGQWQKYWKFKFQYDFADDQSGTTANTNGIKDAYLAYTGFKPVTITVGHHKTPLSMEELTSSKYITFIERAQFVNGIVADTGGGRQYAISAKGYFNNMFTAAGAIYAGSSNEDSAEDATGITGRFTFSPIHEKTKMFHAGIGVDYSRSDNEGGFNIDAEPEIHPGRDILETDGGDYEEVTTWVAEVAGTYGPFNAQFEYASADLSEGDFSPDIDADGWYVYGSYYLTGESRNYKWKKGTYSQTKVKRPLHKGGLGAWEVAFRYASGEFDNSTGTSSDEADVITAALNWYPSNNIRFSANYVNVVDSNAGADAELGPDLDTGASADDAEYFILRSQWYF